MKVGLGCEGRWPAPAKLNLFLHVLGRRRDGRHELQTLFQLLDYGDELDIERRGDGQIRLHHALDGLEPEQDLCWRAARALQESAGCRLGADITLYKRIPMGGGLGGGSSDAATVLRVLNRLWGLDRPVAELAQLGLGLGADVPVFVHGRSAFGQGVGEILQPLDQPEVWYCVVTPDCHVSTAEVFADPRLTRDTPSLCVEDLAGASLRNDCWPVVSRRFRVLREAHERLSQHGEPRLSGTGASLFLSLPERAQAVAIAESLPDAWRAFVARGLNVSPLLHALGEGV